MSEYQQFSLTECNTYRFQDGELDLELRCHPVLSRETISLDGQIAYEIHHPAPGRGYEFDYNGHEYMLIQGHSEDARCNYYYELSRNGEPIQRYEIKPERNRMSAAIICLVALSVVAFFPVLAGEISQRFMGVSALEWGIGVQIAIIVLSVITAVLSAIVIHLIISGRIIIKNLVGADLKPG